jgi:hypothetical protein
MIDEYTYPLGYNYADGTNPKLKVSVTVEYADGTGEPLTAEFVCLSAAITTRYEHEDDQDLTRARSPEMHLALAFDTLMVDGRRITYRSAPPGTAQAASPPESSPAQP